MSIITCGECKHFTPLENMDGGKCAKIKHTYVFREGIPVETDRDFITKKTRKACKPYFEPAAPATRFPTRLSHEAFPQGCTTSHRGVSRSLA